MKLKKAKKIAKERGFNWIAVDALDYIRAYQKKPKILTTDNQFGTFICWTDSQAIIGTYTGGKWWTNTGRRV